MAGKIATPHDAELILKLYDLRREAVMRQARSDMFARFVPKSYDEFIAVTKAVAFPRLVSGSACGKR